ncbi:MAG TPA: ATP-grasp domain-containing protein [Leptospiraceae bacterium]|nr:ATP-grasp domain-containing protein [Leptospiraceae bacterium]
MKVKIAIQDSFIPDEHVTALVNACSFLGIDYECFGLLQFVEDISAIKGEILRDKESLIVPFGSTKLIKLWLKGELPSNWKIFYDKDRYDFKNQILHVGFGGENPLANYLLNVYRGLILDFPDCVDRVFPRDMFVKPTNDLKLFNGQILPARTSLRQVFEQQNVDSDIYERRETVLFTPVKGIFKEWRCFVVDGEVMTSQYKENGQPKKQLASSHDLRIIEGLAKLYNPSGWDDPYVVDICQMDHGEYKILEYNCFHCSGFYAISAEYMLRKLIDFLGKNYV